MQLKLDENGHVAVQDNKPVYVDADGNDVAFDAAATRATITRLNGEAKANRERAEAGEAKMATYNGITDPDAARKALETVKSIDQGQLIAAGEVERVKNEIKSGYEHQMESERNARVAAEQALDNEMIGGAFARSKTISEKLTIPPDMAQSAFGSNFRRVNGQVVGYHEGNPILSRSRPGEVADFEEAVNYLVDRYPHRDRILKGSGATGTGAVGGAGMSGGNGKMLSRAQYGALPPTQQSTFFRSGGSLTD